MGFQKHFFSKIIFSKIKSFKNRKIPINFSNFKKFASVFLKKNSIIFSVLFVGKNFILLIVSRLKTQPNGWNQSFSFIVNNLISTLFKKHPSFPLKMLDGNEMGSIKESKYKAWDKNMHTVHLCSILT